jgi:tryptophan 2,3-dioxygenase
LASSASPRDGSDGGLALLVAEAAAALLSSVPAPVRQVVEISMLPITPMHDERMFLRCVQVFESLYWQVVRCLRRAVAALRRSDPAGTEAELIDAVGRLEALAGLYRVLTTMPREVFAVIRTYSNGRSANQSRPYRLVELMSAPRPAVAPAEGVPPIRVGGPTLQEVFLARADRLGAPWTRRVGSAMSRLDTAWRAMKRTHWGITLKIIGAVPGTGGTAGAAYLEAAAAVPLFPMLVGWPAAADQGRDGGPVSP